MPIFLMMPFTANTMSLTVSRYCGQRMRLSKSASRGHGQCYAAAGQHFLRPAIGRRFLTRLLTMQPGRPIASGFVICHRLLKTL